MAEELGSRTESSPIVRRGIVYFGSEDGTLYALYAKTGRVKWKYQASGAIKASPALSGSTLYVGDYSGPHVRGLGAHRQRRWSTGTSGSKFGFAAGNFYSTPAVDFGRVYAGNTDGKVYSFGARTGTLAWSQSTGGYVYSSPAVANVPGTKPTVYFGSYDGNLYALDARTGATRWTHRGGGRISGGPRWSAASSTSPTSTRSRRSASTPARASASSGAAAAPTTRWSPTASAST